VRRRRTDYATEGHLLLHVHIGPSPLGQTLILPLASEAGFETCLIGREDAPPLPLDERGWPTYTLCWEGAVAETGCAAELPGEVREALLDRESSVLITATLRTEGAAARLPLIREMLTARPAGAETVVMPCENKVPAAWAEVEDACRACGALYMVPLVNRVSVPATCSRPGERRTRTHRLGEWLVGLVERPSRILDALAAAGDFAMVGDLELRKLRKLYLVNGAHLALGIRGALQKRRSLRTAARTPDNAYLTGELHYAMQQGLSLLGNGPPDTAAYAREHFQAYCEVADTVARIMEPLRRTDPRPFLESVEERLAAPAELTAKALRGSAPGGAVEDQLGPYRAVFDSLALVLEDLSAYSDAKTPRLWGTLWLDPKIDRDALAVYERCLLGWERAPAVRRRVAVLERRFANHRAIVAGLD
jgi:hypothetical protein